MMSNQRRSIELEPRTLNEFELNDAKEAAIDIVKKEELNEASKYFAEGLMRKVLTIKEMEEEGQQNPVVVECKADKEISISISSTTVDTDPASPVVVIDQRRQCDYCSCNSTITSTIDESPDNFNNIIREPLSAPF